MAEPPRGWHTVTPRIFAENRDGLIDFLREVFSATAELRANAPAEVTLGDSIILVSDTAFRDATASCLLVYVDDVDATYDRAVAAGATALEPPRDESYGERRAVAVDAWGNAWQLAARI